MALNRVYFFSKTLGIQSKLQIEIPESALEKGRRDIPVIWLLHGGCGIESDWVRYTSAERYAMERGYALIMPCVGISRYCNMFQGGNYYDYIVSELPEVCHRFFPCLSTKREKNYIAGLSLGGSGAISIGLHNPEHFAAIGVLSASSIIPLEYLRPLSAGGPPSPGGPEKPSVNRLNYGVENTEELRGTQHDVLLQARKLAENRSILPKIFHAVGIEDHAYPVGIGLKDFFMSFPGNPFHYEFHQEHGGHTWYFGDKWIEQYMNWLQREFPLEGE